MLCVSLTHPSKSIRLAALRATTSCANDSHLFHSVCTAAVQLLGSDPSRATAGVTLELLAVMEAACTLHRASYCRSGMAPRAEQNLHSELQRALVAALSHCADGLTAATEVDPPPPIYGLEGRPYRSAALSGSRHRCLCSTAHLQTRSRAFSRCLFTGSRLSIHRLFFSSVHTV